MRTKAQLQARSTELADEVNKATAAYEGGRLDKKRYSGFLARATKETEEIEAEIKAYDQAARYSWGTEVAGYDATGTGVAGTQAFNGGPPDAGWLLSGAQLKQLDTAMRSKMPLALEVDVRSKGIACRPRRPRRMRRWLMARCPASSCLTGSFHCHTNRIG